MQTAAVGAGQPRRRLLVVVLAVLMAGLMTGVSSTPVTAKPAGGPFPTSIDLPDGFYPEGIAIDRRTAYVGSLVDGSIWQQDLKSGRNSLFAPGPQAGGIAVGMDVDRHGRLWVAGGGPALAPTLAAEFRVFDTTTGQLLLTQPVDALFVNDVIVTRTAAWFTDSFNPQLIRVPIASDGSIGAPEMVTLAGDWQQVAGDFNANGIVATPSGQHLVVAQSAAPGGDGAALYRVRVDATATELDATRIALDDTVVGADGLALVGRTLYSVSNDVAAPGVVKISLSRALSEGRIVATLPVPGAITPTTADVRGSRLYVVDANFPELFTPTPPPNPDAAFQTTAIRR